MCLECVLKNLSVNDGPDIFAMLQEIPVYENGFENSNNGRSFDEFKEWLVRCHNSAVTDCPDDRNGSVISDLSENRCTLANGDMPKDRNTLASGNLTEDRNGIALSDLLEKQVLSRNVYWLVADGLPVGYGVINRAPPAQLKEIGGNIGYIIRPSQRNRGYGTRFLGMLVKEARNLNIDRPLLVIQNNNTASLSIALHNGGTLEYADPDKSFIRID